MNISKDEVFNGFESIRFIPHDEKERLVWYWIQHLSQQQSLTWFYLRWLTLIWLVNKLIFFSYSIFLGMFIISFNRVNVLVVLNEVLYVTFFLLLKIYFFYYWKFSVFIVLNYRWFNRKRSCIFHFMNMKFIIKN